MARYRTTLPGVFPRRAMAVGTFDFDLRQRGARNIAVAMHVDGSVTILAQQPTFRIFRSTGNLMVQVILYVQVGLGVQPRLFAPLCVVWTAVGKLHDALVTHTDAFAAVVAGIAGFTWDT